MFSPARGGLLLAALSCASLSYAQNASQPVANGYYKCYYFGYSGGLEPSSVGNTRITSSSTYTQDVPNPKQNKTYQSSGTYTFEPMKRADIYGKLTFKGGVLDHHYAYANRKPNGDRALIWPNNESEKAWDPGTTWCYGPY